MEKYHILQLITQGHYKEAKEGLEQYKEQFVIDTDIEMYEQILKFEGRIIKKERMH